jgi:hypothetical protein
MRESCYTCGTEFIRGDDIAILEDEWGVRWKVHAACLDAEFVSADEGKDEGKDEDDAG